MKTIRLKVKGSRCEIRVGAGSYADLSSRMESAGLRPPFLVVSQKRILAHVDRRPLGSYPVFAIPDGERAKTLSTVRRILDKMLELALPRDATLVAFGGGVVGDVAGFAASIYLRGIAVVQIPTTLLAQVDSSVGGKTGVNHPAGKNLIGTFHQPRLVLADPGLLGSLPAREYQSGLYEALKYGVIRDPALFGQFEGQLDAIHGRNPAVLEALVYRCLKIKAEVVSADEKEQGVRRILNFGHTLGHAIEAAAGFRGVTHGEAVGYGMIGATRISRTLEIISESDALRIEKAVRSLGALPPIARLPVRKLMESLKHDKKIKGRALHFILPEEIGKVRIKAEIPSKVVRTVIRNLD